MTEIKVMTNETEVGDILNGNKRYIVRGERDAMKKGDLIRFQLIRNKQEVLHQISNRKYEVTRIDNCMTAPIYRGWKLICFKEV